MSLRISYGAFKTTCIYTYSNHYVYVHLKHVSYAVYLIVMELMGADQTILNSYC